MSKTAEMAASAKVQGRDLGGKYLTFGLAGEEYGLEILKVREIIGMMDITAVPRTPEFVRGVINLRGKVIPVVDLRRKFDMPAAEATDETCIIVVDVGRVEMGIMVDKVSEVLDIASEDIEPPPSFGVSVDTDFILGMGKANNRVTILLDISRVLTGDDIGAIAAASDAAREETTETCARK
ncbi:MAG TPA: chemotaxis protein CheW [Phycisphaerae bacterium]|nr:chemotaxis protein CheW [Phycisphaerae bacterium]